MFRAYGTPYSFDYLLFYKHLMPLASFRNGKTMPQRGKMFIEKGNTREPSVRAGKLAKAKTFVRTELHRSPMRDFQFLIKPQPTSRYFNTIFSFLNNDFDIFKYTFILLYNTFTLLQNSLI